MIRLCDKIILNSRIYRYVGKIDHINIFKQFQEICPIFFLYVLFLFVAPKIYSLFLSMEICFIYAAEYLKQ